MKLSILICTIPGREHFVKRISNIIKPQLNEHCELLFNDAPKSVPTGTKRNQLISQAQGEYFCFIDDDDQVPVYYVNEIMRAIQHNPDCVTFNGYMTTNGTDRRNFVIKLGEKYEERQGVYYRPPNHICPVRKSCVQHLTFKDIWVQEDYHWCITMQRKGVLKTEVHINDWMYHYDFISRKKA